MDAIREYDRQQKIVLQLSDGDFSIEKWKIFESISLHYDYLRYENYRCNQKIYSPVKKITPQYCIITKQQAELFSTILDIQPGQDFKDYFNNLTSVKKRQLIILAGENNEEEHAQLDAPFLLAQICYAFFDKQFVETNIKLGVSELINHCINQIIHDNSKRFMLRSLTRDINFVSGQNGRIQKIPQNIAQKADYTYNGPCYSKEDIINGEKRYMPATKQFDDHYSLCLTNLGDLNPHNNDLLLWIVHNQTKQGTSLPIQNASRFTWGDSGKYLITCSENDMVFSTIQVDQNYNVFRDTRVFSYSHPILYTLFNKQENMVVILLKKDEQNRILKLMRIVDNTLIPCYEEEIGILHDGLFSPDGRILVIASGKDYTSYLTLWDLRDYNTIKKCNELTTKNDVFFSVAFSPDSKKMAFVTMTGVICFLHFRESETWCQKGNLFSNGEFLDKSIKMVYSPDGLLLALLLPAPFNSVILWNTYTGEKIKTLSKKSKGIGFSADSNQLFFTYDGNFSIMQQLFCPESEAFLSNLMKLNLYELCVLHRLYKAIQNKDTVNLYQEEPSYKALQVLPANDRDFIEKYLPYVVINNNEEIIITMTNLFKKGKNWLSSNF